MSLDTPLNAPWYFNRIGLTQMRQDHPTITGQGIAIALVDCPIDHQHPDLANRIIATYTIDSPTHGTTVEATDRPREHGTRLACLMVGADFGIAPEAQIIEFALSSQNVPNIMRAIDNLVQHLEQPLEANTPTICAVNIAMSCPVNLVSNNDHPQISQALLMRQELVRELADSLHDVMRNQLQILPIVSAGNAHEPWSHSGTIDGQPYTVAENLLWPRLCASARGTLSVGASDRHNAVLTTGLSNVTANPYGRWSNLVPTLVAPGAEMPDACPTAEGRPVGSSPATAIVSACAALAAHAQPAAQRGRADVLGPLLQRSCEILPNATPSRQGAGLLRVDRLVHGAAGLVGGNA